MRIVLNIIIVYLFNFNLYSQNREQIKIEYAPFMNFEESRPGATILTRNNSNQVYLKHKGVEMWCNQAIYYEKDDFVEAFGNVKVKEGDSLNMTSKYVEYSGKTQLAYASGDVILIDPTSKLYTETLYFDRIKQEAFYNEKGKVIRDSSGTITSNIGRYFVKNKKYQFNQNVILENPKYVVKSNRLDFYTATGYAFLYGPTTIDSKTSKIYCEKGFYDTDNDTGYFVKKSKIDYNDRTIKGDSIYFNRNKHFASASNNIKVIDTLNNTVVKGHYAEVFKEKDSVYITKNALAIIVQNKDSLYIHSDTLMITGPPEKRIVRGFYNSKIYKSDISGKSDSIHVNQKTGLTQLINFYNLKSNDLFSVRNHPVLWHKKNQITGDSIHLISNFESKSLDSLKVFNNAFITSKDSLGDGFNQISGKILQGYFIDNELKIIDIIKNAETIYHLRNSENELIGIDKSKSASIKILMSENTAEEIKKLNQIDGNTYPENDYPENQKFLKGFSWRENERPKNIEDLFKDEIPFDLPVIKGINDLPTEKKFFDEELLNRVNSSKKNKRSVNDKESRRIPSNFKKIKFE